LSRYLDARQRPPATKLSGKQRSINCLKCIEAWRIVRTTRNADRGSKRPEADLGWRGVERISIHFHMAIWREHCMSSQKIDHRPFQRLPRPRHMPGYARKPRRIKAEWCEMPHNLACLHTVKPLILVARVAHGDQPGPRDCCMQPLARQIEQRTKKPDLRLPF